MVAFSRSAIAAPLGAGLLLVAVAWLRGASTDEQYTLFLTGHAARPTWTAGIITAGEVRDVQAAHAGIAAIARDLRATDVHPPLYFWAAAAWRTLSGDSLFALRLASVLCSVVTLALIAAVARSVGLSPVAAVLLTVGCYGFAYTAALARGFALAQMVSFAGVAVLLAGRRPASAAAGGALLGAATFANYLAVFVAGAALAWLALCQRRRRWPLLVCATLGLAAWLPAILWFYLAQRHSRPDQFAPFEPLLAMARLAQYSAATVFGGLPLYAAGTVRWLIAGLLAILSLALVAQVIWRWRQIATPETRLLFAMAALAPPAGLLLLGIAFNNTPIELRYLAFATPYVGLLLAGALSPRGRMLVLAVQALGLAGLMTRPETMQPARLVAAAAETLVGDGVVLLPHGNDGVGIVGAFAVEAPRTMRLLIVDRDATAEDIRMRIASESRVGLAVLEQDAASRAALPSMRAALTHPCWRQADGGPHVLVFTRSCPDARP